MELLVSLGIFALMTSLLVVKYSNFNQSVLLTNTAFDVSLAIRTAQNYGLSIKSATTDQSTAFFYAYGVNFSTTDNARFRLFGTQTSIGGNDYYDHNSGGSPTDGDVEVSKYNIKRGATISAICTGTDSANCAVTTELNITFKRPDPNAIICADVNGSITCNNTYKYAKITIQATDGSTRNIEVRGNGQISVEGQ